MSRIKSKSYIEMVNEYYADTAINLLIEDIKADLRVHTLLKSVTNPNEPSTSTPTSLALDELTEAVRRIGQRSLDQAQTTDEALKGMIRELVARIQNDLLDLANAANWSEYRKEQYWQRQLANSQFDKRAAIARKTEEKYMRMQAQLKSRSKRSPKVGKSPIGKMGKRVKGKPKSRRQG